LDRYLRVGFDVKLKPADEKCLFDNYEPDTQFQFKNPFNLADLAAGYQKLTGRKAPI
jgi:hypothetical protein